MLNRWHPQLRRSANSHPFGNNWASHKPLTSETARNKGLFIIFFIYFSEMSFWCLCLPATSVNSSLLHSISNWHLFDLSSDNKFTAYKLQRYWQITSSVQGVDRVFPSMGKFHRLPWKIVLILLKHFPLHFPHAFHLRKNLQICSKLCSDKAKKQTTSWFK